MPANANIPSAAQYLACLTCSIVEHILTTNLIATANLIAARPHAVLSVRVAARDRISAPPRGSACLRLRIYTVGCLSLPLFNKLRLCHVVDKHVQ